MKLDAFILAQTSYSRRDVLAMITSGRVIVNGNPAKSMVKEIKIGVDIVKIDGLKLGENVRYFYYKFNKPTHVVSSLGDPQGRKCLKSFMGGLPASIKPVGRLDRETSGLMIFTNDGQFSNELMHPSRHTSKLYRVTLNRRLTKADFSRVLSGVMLDDGPAKGDSLEWVSDHSVDLVIHEGRNRLIRRLFEALGYTVEKLKRLAIGNVQLGTLAVGQFAQLSMHELRSLKMTSRR